MLGNQLSAARALLGWTQKQLAAAAGVSVPTVKRAEGSGQISASSEAISAIRYALENAGIEFLSENGSGAGVRFRDRQQFKERTND